MIGIFDSGLGGLSVRKELAKLMPNQDFCYIADSAFCPYGRKSPEILQDRCRKLTNFLLEQRNCKGIVVACNTATAAAIDILRSEYSIPFIGMEPAIKPALIHSKTGVVGVLATAGTFKGALYHRTLTQFQGDVKVIEEIGDGLVELVESNHTYGDEAKTLLTKYLKPMIEANVDYIVLGCTHYPFLTPMIENILKENNVVNNITIINPAPAVALQTQKILNLNTNEKDLNPNWNFYSTGNEVILQTFVESIISDFLNNRKKDMFPCLNFHHLDIS